MPQEPEPSAASPTPAEPPAAPSGVAGRFDRVVAALDGFQRRHRPLAFVVGVLRKFGDDEAGSLAALVAYYGFFSLFPLLLVLVTVVSSVLAGRPDLQQRLVDSALSQFPVIGDELRANVGQIHGSGVALVIGVVVALWGGTAAMEAAQRALNVVWAVPRGERPNTITSHLRSFAVLGVLALGLVASAALSAVTATASAPAVGRIGLGLGSLAVAIALFLVAYRLLPAVPLAWRWLWPGAVLAGTAWVVLQALGAAIVDRQLRGASQVYGVFGLVLGLLSWLYLQAQVTVLAAEVNVVRARRLWPRSLRDEPDGDEPDGGEVGAPAGSSERFGVTQPGTQVDEGPSQEP